MKIWWTSRSRGTVCRWRCLCAVTVICLGFHRPPFCVAAVLKSPLSNHRVKIWTELANLQDSPHAVAMAWHFQPLSFLLSSKAINRDPFALKETAVGQCSFLVYQDWWLALASNPVLIGPEEPLKRFMQWLMWNYQRITFLPNCAILSKLIACL